MVYDDGILYELLKNINGAIQYCDFIGNVLRFDYKGLMHCCIGHKMKKIPIICEFSGGTFPFQTYFQSVRKCIVRNIAGIGDCAGCIYLKKDILSPRCFSVHHIQELHIAHFRQCQLRCQYCFFSHLPKTQNYNNAYAIQTTLADLFEKKMINEDTVCEWSGTEPTLYEDFEKAANYMFAKGMFQVFVTNGLLSSEVIRRAVANGKGSILISVDSGKEETYRRIKGLDCSEQVWKNIEDYIACSNKSSLVHVKYIICENNSSDAEYECFVRKCLNAGVSSVCITPDWRFNENETNYYINARRLSGLVKRNGINVSVFDRKTRRQLNDVITSGRGC